VPTIAPTVGGEAVALMPLAQLGEGERRKAELDFARSWRPASDEQKALEEAGGDFRALRVGP
jgi:hypothetical protein